MYSFELNGIRCEQNEGQLFRSAGTAGPDLINCAAMRNHPAESIPLGNYSILAHKGQNCQPPEDSYAGRELDYNGRWNEKRGIFMIDGILFDLDGTLWDSVAEIAAAWSGAMARLGVERPPLTAEELRPWMGLRLEDIAARMLPDLPEKERLAVMERCCRAEEEHLRRRPGAVYPGVEETLAALKGRYPLFVVSNCQDGYIQAFFEGTGLGKYFRDFECAGRTGLPKSGNIRLVAERNGLKCPVYVGDTQLDARSAREAGVPFLHAGYGFGTVEDAPELSRFSELPERLGELGKSPK